ncbi:MAG TPA: DUF6338 family protein [Pyrinomonadaceae bacterium]|jgi:hypothetical protein
MEFAFSALLLLILILPGFIIQFTYTRGFWRWNSPNAYRPLTEQIPSGIVAAAVLHLIWASICTLLISPINLKALMMLLLGNYGHDEQHLETVLESVTNSPYKIAFYFLSLYVFSALIGYLLHWFVRRVKLDRKTRFFRFNNEWFYALRGELAQFRETPDVEGMIAGILLTTIVHHEGQNYLYRGFVYDFFFDKSGNLDRVILLDTDRRDLSQDRVFNEEDEGRYYEIEGDYFILRYSEMSTINLYYITFEEEADDSTPDVEIVESEIEVA